MANIELKSIKKSTKSDKKLMATFIKNGREKTIHFGAKGMSDYTIHKDPERKQRYINRHKKRENWNDPMTAGSLSRWVLWNKKSLKASIDDYKKRFKLKSNNRRKSRKLSKKNRKSRKLSRKSRKFGKLDPYIEKQREMFEENRNNLEYIDSLETRLFNEIQTNNIPAIKNILTEGTRYWTRDILDTAMSMAGDYGNLNIIKLLEQYGANIELALFHGYDKMEVVNYVLNSSSPSKIAIEDALMSAFPDMHYTVNILITYYINKFGTNDFNDFIFNTLPEDIINNWGLDDDKDENVIRILNQYSFGTKHKEKKRNY